MISAIGGIFMIAFGVFWTFVAASFHPIMALFGIGWTLIAIIQTVYNFKNATSDKRYSSFDITDDGEESDPLNDRFGNVCHKFDDEINCDGESKYCPYCGNKVEQNFKYCNNCGKKLP